MDTFVIDAAGRERRAYDAYRDGSLIGTIWAASIEAAADRAYELWGINVRLMRLRD